MVVGSFGSEFWLLDDVKEGLSGIFCWSSDTEIFYVVFLITGVRISVLTVPVVWIIVLRISFRVSRGMNVVFRLMVIEGGELLVDWLCGVRILMHCC